MINDRYMFSLIISLFMKALFMKKTASFKKLKQKL